MCSSECQVTAEELHISLLNALPACVAAHPGDLLSLEQGTRCGRRGRQTMAGPRQRPCTRGSGRRLSAGPRDAGAPSIEGPPMTTTWEARAATPPTITEGQDEFGKLWNVTLGIPFFVRFNMSSSTRISLSNNKFCIIKLPIGIRVKRRPAFKNQQKGSTLHHLCSLVFRSCSAIFLTLLQRLENLEWQEHGQEFGIYTELQNL